MIDNIINYKIAPLLASTPTEEQHIRLLPYGGGWVGNYCSKYSLSTIRKKLLLVTGQHSNADNRN